MRLKRGLALALAGGSLAIGVPAAVAAGGGSDAQPATAPPAATIQDDQQQQRPDRGDCPEKGGGDGANGAESGASGTTAL